MVVPPVSPAPSRWSTRRWRRTFAIALLVAWAGFQIWNLVRKNLPRPDLANPAPNSSAGTTTPAGTPPTDASRPSGRVYSDLANDDSPADPSAPPPPNTATPNRGGPDRGGPVQNATDQNATDRGVTDRGGGDPAVTGRRLPPGPPPRPGIPGSPTSPTPRGTPPQPPAGDPLAGPAPPPPRGDSQVVRVKRVIDGDTLLLSDGTRVRMIGVDTPETKMEGAEVQPFGPEASEFVKQAVARGPVTLVFDGESEDNYGRILAHVCVNDRFIGEDLIRLGYARALYRHPYSNAVKDRFRAAENAAKAEKRGIWSLAEPPRHPAPVNSPGTPPNPGSSRPGTSRPTTPRPPAPRPPTPAGSRDF